MTGSVLTNPLVLACLIGTVLGLYEVDVPEIVLELLDVLSQLALPLGLLAVGAGIRFMAFGRQSWQLAVAVLGKLLVFPALVVVATQLFGVSPDLAAVLLLLTCLPALRLYSGPAARRGCEPDGQHHYPADGSRFFHHSRMVKRG